MQTWLRQVGRLLLVLAGVMPLAAPAQPVAFEVPAISLVTFGPGPLYWERFGHNAILVDDGVSARLYNFGVFDFAQKHFFLNFARGRMVYRLDEQDWRAALAHYAASGRWVVQQQLALPPQARRALADDLAVNARPEHAEYRYDYFTANCSTRVRDALDAATGGALRRHAEAQRSARSYRFEATRLMAPMPALALGMDLGLGPAADRSLNAWQLSFVPMTLMQVVREVRVADAQGAPRPLVLHESRLVASDAWPEPAAPRRWLLPALLLGLAAAAGIWQLARRREHERASPPFAVLASLFSLLSGIGGLILLLGWFGTDHVAMHANRNLLLLSPLSLLLLPATLRSWSPTYVPSVWNVLLAAAIGLGASLAPLLLLLADAQQNLPWIALLLPAHATLALVLARARRIALTPIAR